VREQGAVSIIRVSNLVKEFRRPKLHDGPFAGVRTFLTHQYIVERAVNEISFSVERGELVGYLGPNGAGKSTTIKMLAGILVPTSGTVEVAGVAPWRDRKRNARQVGVVFGQRSQLWWDLPLRDSLSLIGKIYEVEKTRLAENQERLIDLLAMSDFLNTPVRQLSLGQRMRGDLAAALLYDPEILYLDEPTVGLDVVAKERIRNFIAELNREKGTTVILTTHDMDDVEKLCQRVILIDRGNVAYDGSVNQLKARYAPLRDLHVTTDDRININGVETLLADGGRVILRFDPTNIAPSDLVREVVNTYRVSDIAIAEPELEGVIHRIYSGQS
jgi:ABC-2 type transport system ATP-binding protein